MAKYPTIKTILTFGSPMHDRRAYKYKDRYYYLEDANRVLEIRVYYLSTFFGLIKRISKIPSRITRKRWSWKLPDRINKHSKWSSIKP